MKKIDCLDYVDNGFSGKIDWQTFEADYVNNKVYRTYKGEYFFLFDAVPVTITGFIRNGVYSRFSVEWKRPDGTVFMTGSHDKPLSIQRIADIIVRDIPYYDYPDVCRGIQFCLTRFLGEVNGV